MKDGLPGKFASPEPRGACRTIQLPPIGSGPPNEELFSALLDSAPDAMVVADRDVRIGALRPSQGWQRVPPFTPSVLTKKVRDALDSAAAPVT
jgi:hypothetical protein